MTQTIFRENPGFLYAELSQCRPQLFGIARRLTCNRDEAEDLVQDTLLRAFRGADTFRGTPTRDAVLRWLSAIMRNHFYTLCANKKRGGISESFSFDEQLIAGMEQSNFPNNNPAFSFEQRQRLNALLDTLGKLSAPQREILLLSVFEQLSYEEISARLHVPVGTVRSRLHRARSRVARATLAWYGSSEWVRFAYGENL